MAKKIMENGSMFFRAYVALIFVDFGLRFFGFRRTVKTVLKERNSAENEAAAIDWARISRTVEIAQRTFRLYLRPRTECLERSLVIYYLLRQEGIPAQLCIGCTKYPPLKFHAWVECAGRVINDLNSIKESHTKITVK